MQEPAQRAKPAIPTDPAAGANPVLVELWRGGAVESVHRGSWVLCDGGGAVLDGAGDWETPVFSRSSIKALQALPLVESGAADRFGFEPADLALAVSSHNGEPCHTERAAAMLARIELGEPDLRCGVHPPGDPDVAFALRARGERPSQLHNNCSGKHAGFLAVARHLAAPTASYLDPDGPGQRLVCRAVGEMARLDPDALAFGIDGCSAPNWRLPLRGIATAFARLATPDGGGDLAPGRAAACRRILDAVAANPILIAGSQRRACTDLARATGGRLFPKIGAEGVYVIGVRDGDRGLAIKLDDGGKRGLLALVFALVERLGLAGPAELERLAAWRDRRQTNHAGLEVGRIEVRPG
jgi:L-asparaginase II